MDSLHQTADSAAAAGMKVTAAMTHGGAFVSIFGGWTLNDVAIVVGIAVSVVGLLGNWAIQWYWRAREHEIARERLEWDRRRHDEAVERERRLPRIDYDRE